MTSELESAPERDGMSLDKATLPPLFRAADRASIRQQTWFFALTGGGLVLLLLAALFGALTIQSSGDSTDWAGVVSLVAFVFALVLRLRLMISHPDKSWYDGRAVAESTKTLAWRYAVGGQPFVVDGTNLNASDPLFIQRLEDVLKATSSVSLAADAESGAQITEMMRRLRASGLEDRKKAYLQGRIVNQQDWYASMARQHERLNQRWSWATLLLEAFGIIGALAKALGYVDVDLLGFFAAGGAAVVAWSQARQDSSVARAYAIAAQELGGVRALIAANYTEGEWAAFVDNAEEAISREHTLWRASRA